MAESKHNLTTLSPKQLDVFTWWTNPLYKNKNGIICDGAIRSGKTTAMFASFTFWAMATFDSCNFGVCGKTIQSLRRNVITSGKLLLEANGYKVTEHRAENYYTVEYGSSRNDFYLFGGKDESSQDLIQGITLAGLFLDECALMPESFVNQATGRCSVEGSKLWFNCNPEAPDHFIKTEWIDKISEKNMIRIHFTMYDNPSLTFDILHRYETMYSGVFYDRYVKGLWVLASGLVFRYFAENPAPYLCDTPSKVGWYKIIMGIDFGGNGSKTTMVLAGYRNKFNDIYILSEDSLPVTEDIDAERICSKFIEFYRKALVEYGRVDWVFPDSASPTMINSLRSVARRMGLPFQNIKGCRKNEISERPKTIDLLLNTGRLHICKKCTDVIKALSSLRWDEKKPDVPEDLNIGNCNDWYDALCYTMLDYIEYIDLNRS